MLDSGSKVLSGGQGRILILVSTAIVAMVAVLVSLQVVASVNGFTGPLDSLGRDYIGRPEAPEGPWGALILALLGLRTRDRWIAVGVAAGIDIAWVAVRLLLGDPFAAGNGPLIVLTAIPVVAWLRWQGKRRTNALRAAALGALLILAGKVGSTWLEITIMTQPEVLDEYLLLADRALGEPSWMLGQLVDALGAPGYTLLYSVYLQLSLAGVVVAVWQLRNVVRTGKWPSHHVVRTFLVLGLIGPLFYMLFPVVGPVYIFGSAGGEFALGDYWPTIVPAIPAPDWVSFDNLTPRNCMPSMHTAWAVALFLHTRRDIDGGPLPRWLRWGGAFWMVATLAATLGLGYHYGVDLVAGVVLVLTVDSALRAPERGWGGFRIRLVTGGAILMTALLLSYRYLAEQMAEYPVLAGTLILGALLIMGRIFWRTWFAPVPQHAPAVELGESAQSQPSTLVGVR